MALLLNAQELEIRYGADPLFRNLSFDVSEGDRTGLIGPNGSGKSTLLEVLAGQRQPDKGTVALRKNTKLSYVAQLAEFAKGETVRSVFQNALDRAQAPEADRERLEGETLGRTGFTDFDLPAEALSGGWRKRLAIAEALAARPDILLLDEPTNHLDLAGIEWLERLLQNAAFACVVVSHDRYFLENAVTEVAELNRVYPDGVLRVAGAYSAFLQKKSEFLAAQARHQEALENRVRNEIAWLRRGPKARATKAKARIDNAHELIGELKDLNARTRTSSADIDFTATERATKRLVSFEHVAFGYPERPIVNDLQFAITAGMRVGLMGPNGSGKTTLLRLLRGELKPQRGTIHRAASLRTVYFEQDRTLDPELTLKRALAPDADSVIYQDRTIHVASWAARFLFTSEQLNQPVRRLSGGERARVLIAKLMLEPADLLLLDEPTNDLDIETLEIFEESLLEFSGALVLVTHDRFMLDRLSTVVLGLDGEGNTGRFADYSQWEAWVSEKRKPSVRVQPARVVSENSRAPGKKKLSYLDNRDLETIEERIMQAEELLAGKRVALESPEVVRDSHRLQQALRECDAAQSAVEALYSRWGELEVKLGNISEAAWKDN
ncbi:MAG: ABC-F family ATP-binding cassette domain-containing protein [Acidobacteriaceae bacterium]|nr:ABC-F family ATP-binding cassette domain-containing protein [Acidobacteriaceae bacterium]